MSSPSPIAEAAKKLGITENNLYYEAIEGRLKLSVNFVNDVLAIPGKIVPKETQEITIDGIPRDLFNGEDLRDDRTVFVGDGPAVPLRERYELPMIGREYFFIQELCTGVAVNDLTDFHIEGTYVIDDCGRHFQLCKKTRAGYIHPASLKDFSCQLVVSSAAIEEYIKLLACGGHTRRTPEQIVEDERRAGRKDHEIAKILNTELGDSITAYKIGTLLPANPGAHVEKTSSERHARRLLCKKEKPR